MIYKLNTKLTFGKHKGKTVKQILDDAPTYIRWCLENINSFEMSKLDQETALLYAHQVDLERYEEDYMVIDLYDFCDWREMNQI